MASSSAACSLKCGDCGLIITSVKDAELHAEATGHSNFEESTEALRARKCVTCGKLCRSTVEEDQHRRHTGHDAFQDADVVMTDVIDEKTKLTGGYAEEKANGDAEEKANGATQDDDRVNALVSMGFSRNKALRALHHSGDGTVEQAIEWISSHEDDPACSDEPFVAPPKLTPEQAKAKAEELLKQAKIKREKEEKAMEKLREAERIRSGKEMAAIARKEEEQRLKRMVELREREKREEKAAREKIRKKLEQDRMERRARAGLPPEPTHDHAGPSAETGATDRTDVSRLPAKPREKGDTMRGLLVALKKGEPDEAARRTAFETLTKLVGNVAREPANPKFRTIKLENKAIQARVGRFADAVEFLRVCGWTDGGNGNGGGSGGGGGSGEDGQGTLVLPDEAVDDAVLRMALENLDSAINNPFFGSL